MKMAPHCTTGAAIASSFPLYNLTLFVAEDIPKMVSMCVRAGRCIELIQLILLFVFAYCVKYLHLENQVSRTCTKTLLLVQTKKKK